MGGTNFSRIDELSDLVKKQALFLHVRRVEHRAREHERPMEGNALALKEIELYGMCVVHNTDDVALRFDQVRHNVHELDGSRGYFHPYGSVFRGVAPELGPTLLNTLSNALLHLP